MMRISSFVAGFIAAIALLASVVVFAQENPLALLRPMIVKIDQTVPLTADVVVPVDDGESVTATVPLTVEVSLQIRLSGVVSGSAAVVESAPQVTVEQALTESDGSIVDNLDIPYEIENADGIEILQWRAKTEFDGSIGFFGELRNVDEKRNLTSSRFNVNLYDAEGTLLENASGIMTKMDDVQPGKTAAFLVYSTTPTEDVTSYLVQVEGSFR